MRKSFFGILGLVAVLVLITASTVPAHPPISDDYQDTEHGFSVVEYSRLWSGDEDRDTPRNSSPTWVALLETQDYEWVKPPKTANKWNPKEVHDFKQGDISTSVHPPHADLSNKGFIKDAYVQIFSVSPSVRMLAETYTEYGKPKDQDNARKWKVYVNQSGTISGTLDYRVAVPDDKTDSWPKKVYEFNHSKVEKIVVYANHNGKQTVVGTGTTSDGSFTIEYSDLPADTETITVAAVVNVSINKTVHKKPPTNPDNRDESSRDPADDENNDGNSDTPSDGPDVFQDRKQTGISGAQYADLTPDVYPHKNEDAGTVGTHTSTNISKKITVSDTIQVEVGSTTPTVETAKKPNGEVLVRFETIGVMWDRIETPYGVINNLWEYYTHRDPRWDKMVKSTEDGDKKRHSNVHPVQVVGFPAKYGVHTEDVTRFEITEVSGFKGDPKDDLSPRENVKVQIQSEYKYPFKMNLKVDEDANHNFKKYRLHTVYPGGNGQVPEYQGQHVMKEPVLNAAVVDRNKTKGEVKVKVMLIHPETGKYMTTSNRFSAMGDTEEDSSRVVVNGEEVEIKEQKPVTVWVNNTPSGDIPVRYEPRPWAMAEKDQTYVWMETSTTASVWMHSIDNYVEFFLFGFSRLLPFFLFLYMIDKGFGIDVWPLPFKKWIKEYFGAMLPSLRDLFRW